MRSAHFQMHPEFDDRTFIQKNANALLGIAFLAGCGCWSLVAINQCVATVSSPPAVVSSANAAISMVAQWQGELMTDLSEAAEPGRVAPHSDRVN